MYKTALIIIIGLLFACNNNPSKPSSPANSDKLIIPKIPVSITDQGSGLIFLSKHYWDNFDFSDSLSLRSSELTQTFVQYINIVRSLPLKQGISSMEQFMAKTQGDSTVFEYFYSLGEKLLHDPNSQIRNQELYIPVLQAAIESRHVDSLMKLRPQYQLELALKNRIGQAATDFEYMLIDGSKSRLTKLESPFTVIMFNNPGCEACAAIIAYIEKSQLLQALIESKNLTMLAIFADADIQAWRSYAQSIPSTWLNGYDHLQKINEQELYDLKAIPTLYLLDNNKKVMLKDPDVNQLESYLNFLISSAAKN